MSNGAGSAEKQRRSTGAGGGDYGRRASMLKKQAGIAAKTW
ncbi:hypothetical protein C7S14_7244 [Burkholderia cepacia]|nr:hypothetical protein C7S14_7244 [Burkholderia cepacia]